MNLPKNKVLKNIVWCIVIFLAVQFSVVATIYINKWTIPMYVPELENLNTPFSEDCVFFRKIMGGDFVISEPDAGTYRYEIYATSEGIEVWKCNKF